MTNGSEFMPSKTFYNLPEEKKQKLMKAAMEEFCNHNFMDVSINKIIINANIPRGSFYMYFEDKEDLFEYIINSYSMSLENIVNDALIRNYGDIRKAFILLYDELISRIKKIKYKNFFNNVFIFLNLKREQFFNRGHQIFEGIKKNISIDNIKTDDLEFIFITLMHTLIMGIGDTLQTTEELKEKERFLRKLDMICYGFYKK